MRKKILAWVLQLNNSDINFGKGGEIMNVKIYLNQHIGVPSTPIVKENEEVLKGQLIAKPEGLGSNIHSSVYGVVKKVSKNFIEIDGFDKQNEEFVKTKETDDYLEAIKEAGIVGAGGAGFPTHVKLNTSLEGGYVIANAAECEPTLGHNMKLLEENPGVVIKGIKYAMEITNASKALVVIKPKNKKAIINLAKRIKDDKDIEIRFLPDLYPSGDERVIIREVLGVELEPGKLPLEAKAVVCNVETLKNITLAIEERKPVIEKDITVGGRIKGAKKGKIFLNVPIGVSAKSIISKTGELIKPHGEIIMGGAFTGSHGNGNSTITKTTGGIAVTMPFPTGKTSIGILACECGAEEGRLEEIVTGMGGKVVASTRCDRMVKVGNVYKCEKPGVCPGQAKKVLELKKKGAEAVLVGTCQD